MIPLIRTVILLFDTPYTYPPPLTTPMYNKHANILICYLCISPTQIRRLVIGRYVQSDQTTPLRGVLDALPRFGPKRVPDHPPPASSLKIHAGAAPSLQDQNVCDFKPGLSQDVSFLSVLCGLNQPRLGTRAHPSRLHRSRP